MMIRHLRSSRASVGVLGLVVLGCQGADKDVETLDMGTGAQKDPAVSMNRTSLNRDEFLAVRCSRDLKTTYFVGHGKVYAEIPGKPPQLLFLFAGLDITRCVKNPAQGYTIAGRELSYYLDPTTGQKIDRWYNPFTSETVPVVHISNSLLQLDAPPSFKLSSAAAITTLDLELAFSIPNVLPQPQFADYLPSPTIDSVSSYKFAFAQSALTPGVNSVEDVALTFFETGPWRPWMKMGARPGRLLYSITAYKVRDFANVPEPFQSEIRDRLPLYREAPSCKVAAPNSSTWTQFADLFPAYQAGQTFPLPAPVRDEPCVAP